MVFEFERHENQDLSKYLRDGMTEGILELGRITEVVLSLVYEGGSEIT